MPRPSSRIDSATQQDVDNALKALTDAYAGLTEKTPEPAPVSKSELDKKIKAIEAEKLDESKYTAESWKAFETALAHAKAVIASDSATQQDVDAALGALTSARDGLTEKGEVKPDPKPEPGTVDKAALDKAVKEVEAEKLDGSKYTAKSWKAFETALAHAKAVMGNANSTQFDIDNALSMLNDARAALKEKPGQHHRHHRWQRTEQDRRIRRHHRLRRGRDAGGRCRRHGVAPQALLTHTETLAGTPGCPVDDHAGGAPAYPQVGCCRTRRHAVTVCR